MDAVKTLGPGLICTGNHSLMNQTIYSNILGQEKGSGITMLPYSSKPSCVGDCLLVWIGLKVE